MVENLKSVHSLEYFRLAEWLVRPISLNEEENLILENYKEA